MLTVGNRTAQILVLDSARPSLSSTLQPKANLIVLENVWIWSSQLLCFDSTKLDTVVLGWRVHLFFMETRTRARSKCVLSPILCFLHPPRFPSRARSIMRLLATSAVYSCTRIHQSVSMRMRKMILYVPFSLFSQSVGSDGQDPPAVRTCQQARYDSGQVAGKKVVEKTIHKASTCLSTRKPSIHPQAHNR